VTIDRTSVPTLAPPIHAALPPFSTHVLRNGLEVAIAETHSLPIVAARLVIRAGAAADAPERAGRASLTAAVIDEGTSKRSALEIAGSLERLGADLVVSADWDQTVLALQVLSGRIDPAFALLAEVATDPAFQIEEFARKKQERLTALLQERDDPAVIAARGFVATVYGSDHPYGTGISGDRRTVGSLERDMLVRFHDDYYRPANAFLVVVGDVSPARLIPTLERVFESWAAGPVEPVTVPRVPAQRAMAIRIMDRPGAPQSELRMGHAGPPRTTEDYFPLVVMNTILGGSFTSRLNTRLREEKGYTYGVRSSFSFRSGPGPFVVSTAIGTNVSHAAVEDTLGELERIRDDLVPEAELETARNFLALGLPRRFETVDAITEHIADLLLHRLPHDYYDHYMARVGAVTAGEVRAAAQKYLDPKHTVVVLAGDAESIEGPLAALGVGPVERSVPDDNPFSGTALA
jgi:zinc protease